MSASVAFVCQWFPPEPMAVPESIALALRDEGLGVEVLTGVPNYPTGQVAEGYSATRVCRETIKGLPVHRTPLYPSHDSNPFRRVANYVSWSLSCALFGQRVLRRADAALVYSSPASAALPALVAKVLWRTPYVLLIQDVWPDSIFASGIAPRGRRGRFLWRVADVFVRRTYAMADHVAVISPGMVNLLVERGVPRGKLTLVHNWLPEDDVEGGRVALDAGPRLHAMVGAPPKARIFFYAGNHGRAQALETLVDAFAAGAPDAAHLVMLGDGLAKEVLRARAAGAARVHFLDPVPRHEAARLARTADVQVVSLADDPLFASTMPSKLQSALASGHPVLAVASGDVATTVTGAGAGLAAQPGDVAAVREAVRRLSGMDSAALAEMGACGTGVYRTQMSREVGAPLLASLLRAAARRPTAPQPTEATIADVKEGA